MATVLYTSGTTGQPKGVPLTHANLLHQMSSLACVAYPEPGAPVLSVLPIWHAYERSASYSSCRALAPRPTQPSNNSRKICRG